MGYELAKAWRAKESIVQLTLPVNHIKALPNVPSRMTITLSEATQEQLAILFSIGHPAVVQAKKESK